MEKKRKATTIRLSNEDIKAILAIRLNYGLASDNQAIIFASPSLRSASHVALVCKNHTRTQLGG